MDSVLFARALVFLSLAGCFLPNPVVEKLLPLTGLLGLLYMTRIAPARLPQAFRRRLVVGYLLFAAGYVLSLVFGRYAGHVGLEFVVRDLPFVAQVALVPALVLAWGELDARTRRAALGFSLACVAVLSLWGIGQALGWIGHRGPPDAGAARAYQSRPIYLAWQLVPWLVAAPWIALAGLRMSRAWTIAFASCTVLAALAGLASGNRSLAGLTLISWVLALALAGLRRDLRTHLKWLAPTTLVLALLIQLAPASRRVFKPFGQTGVTQREFVWATQTRAFLDNPVYGVGRRLNRTRLYFDYSSVKHFKSAHTLWNAHNIFIDLAASMGLLGLSGFLLIFAPRMKRSRRRAPSPLLWPVGAAALSWLAVALIQSPLEAHNALSAGLCLSALLSSLNVKVS